MPNYERPDGEIIRLDTVERWERIGRSGFAAPSLKLQTAQFINGMTRVMAAIPQTREIALPFIIKGDTRERRDEIRRKLAHELTSTGQLDGVGKLHFSEGVYLNCIYSGGLDEITADYPLADLFELRFTAGDPYFYSEELNEVRLGVSTEALYLSENLYLGDELYLISALSENEQEIDNRGEETYPVITITGPASVIRIENGDRVLAMASDFDLVAGDVLEINCSPDVRRVYKNGEDVTHRLLAGTSLNWPIRRGLNAMRLYFTNGNDDTEMRVQWRERTLSL